MKHGEFVAKILSELNISEDEYTDWLLWPTDPDAKNDGLTAEQHRLIIAALHRDHS